MRLIFLIFVIGTVVSIASLPAEEPGEAELRQLKDKDHNKIEARILSISGDRRMLRIERSDGRMFEIEIIKLSLDSQQEVKNWLTGQPGASESLSLEMAAQRSDGESSREKLDGPSHRATWERKRMGYRIAVTNRTAESAGNLRLEYCLLLKDRVSVRPAKEVSEEDPVRWRIRSAGEIRYLRGAVELPALRFNDEELVDTATLAFDSVRVSGGNRETAEDEPIGLLARVVDLQGRTVTEFNDLNRAFAGLNWEILQTRFDPQEAEGTGMLVEKMALR